MIDGKGDQQFTNSQKKRRTNVRDYIDLRCQGRSRGLETWQLLNFASPQNYIHRDTENNVLVEVPGDV